MKSLKDPGLHRHYRHTQFTSSVWSSCYFCVELKQKLSLMREYRWKIILQVFILSTSHSQGWHLTTTDSKASYSEYLFQAVLLSDYPQILGHSCRLYMSPFQIISESILCLIHTVSHIASNLYPYLKFSRENTPSHEFSTSIIYNNQDALHKQLLRRNTVPHEPVVYLKKNVLWQRKLRQCFPVYRGYLRVSHELSWS